MALGPKMAQRSPQQRFQDRFLSPTWPPDSLQETLGSLSCRLSGTECKHGMPNPTAKHRRAAVIREARRIYIYIYIYISATVPCARSGVRVRLPYCSSIPFGKLYLNLLRGQQPNWLRLLAQLYFNQKISIFHWFLQCFVPPRGVQRTNFSRSFWLLAPRWPQDPQLGAKMDPRPPNLKPRAHQDPPTSRQDGPNPTTSS